MVYVAAGFGNYWNFGFIAYFFLLDSAVHISPEYFSGTPTQSKCQQSNWLANDSTANQTLPPTAKSDMVKIAGGEFTMGNNNGKDREKPANIL